MESNVGGGGRFASLHDIAQILQSQNQDTGVCFQGQHSQEVAKRILTFGWRSSASDCIIFRWCTRLGANPHVLTTQSCALSPALAIVSSLWYCMWLYWAPRSSLCTCNPAASSALMSRLSALIPLLNLAIGFMVAVDASAGVRNGRPGWSRSVVP